MADELRMALLELLCKAELERDTDFLREGVRALAEALMELEVSQHLGAEKHERTEERRGYRNGYRERAWDTRVGTLQVKGEGAAGARWQLLPAVAGAPQAGRAGAGGGGSRSVRPRSLDAAGRSGGAGARVGGHLGQPGLAAVQSAR